MKEPLLGVIKQIIKDKGTHPELATFVEVRRGAESLGDKAQLNLAFRELVAEGKIRVRPGIKSKLVEVV